MKIDHGDYIIELSKLPEPVGEHAYKSHLVKDGYGDFLTITVSNQSGEHVSKAIIDALGMIITPYDNSCLGSGNKLLVCVGEDVCCLHIPDLDLLWRTTCDDASCFTIHDFNGGYVIHGEMAITHVNKNGEIVWQFSGRDIFVLHEEQDYVFKIEDDIIMVKEWDGYEYHINKDGRCINEFRY